MAGVAAEATTGRRIVVAVDEGEESFYALSWCLTNVVAAAPAKASAEEGGNDAKDTLILLHARPSRVVYPVIDGTGFMFSADVIATLDGYNNQVADALMSKAKRLCAHHPNVKVQTCVTHGDPRDVICETVEKLGPDMLVLGSHGYGLIKRALLGSVSNHCAQNVRCPVLIVKRP